MGFIKTTVIIIGPLTGLSLYSIYKLGNKLPNVCRKTGNNIGLFYRYFKIVIKTIKPDTQNEILIKKWRQSSFR